MMPLNILIAMPCGRGTVAASTVAALAELFSRLNESGIHHRFLCIEGTDLVLARSMFATLAHRQSHISHLLFIDDDMTFDSDAILGLLRADKPLVGCVCPKRTIDLEKLHRLAAKGISYDQALAQALSFVTALPANSEVAIRDGLCPMTGIGMAVTLIRRDVLETMVQRQAVTRYETGKPDMFGNDHFYDFFGQVYSPEAKSLLSEDLSFCKRWREDCSGEVWGLATHEIGHIGWMTYSGKYIDRLKAGVP
ncbi:MAG: hypothetical protein ACRCUX_02235 [Beijerinckiaceae bacterium]